MDFQVNPAPARSGTVTVPGDKSISHRALMLGSIAEGTTEISGFLAGEDCLATLDAFLAMGVAIERQSATELTVHGVGLNGLSAPAGQLDLGNSGTAMRLMTGLLAAQRFSSELIGDESLNGRPMTRIITPLTEMGAVVGRPFSDSSPISSELNLCAARSPVMSRIAVPELPRSSLPAGADRPLSPTPCTVSSVALCRSITTPIERKASSVARQSSPARNPEISVVPSAMLPSISARCEIDLSPGTVTVPERAAAGGIRKFKSVSEI